jgi:glucokinase
MKVLTLDAGGTNFVFSAIEDGRRIGTSIRKPSNGDNLDLCLKNIIDGFTELKNQSNSDFDAISFAFPGPADFKHGIIGDLHNLTGFKGGVALGPMLEEIFNVPVFINNDGDLYAYGEALAGSLPLINSTLEAKGSSKRYHNVCGMTIGTGFGAGLVHNGILIKGDNICAGEIWVTSNRMSPDHNSEEGVSIRAVRYFYAEFARISFEETPEPREIYNIGVGLAYGNREAAIKAYEKLGRFIGDAIANMITLFDGIVVIGGGVAGAKDLIIPGISKELSHSFSKLNGGVNQRLTHKVFCLNNSEEAELFYKDRGVEITVPYSNKKVIYDSVPRSAYVFSNFDTSEMISMGAYWFVAEKLK